MGRSTCAVCAGLTSLLPDYLMLCVCAVSGLTLTTREHFAAALALDIPVFCVLTKVDLAPEAVLQRTLHDTRAMLATAADTVKKATRPGLAGCSTDDASDAGDARGGPAPESTWAGDLVDVPEGGVFDADDQQELSAHRRMQVCQDLLTYI